MQRVYDLLEPFPPEKAARIVDLVVLMREVGIEPARRIATMLADLPPEVCAHVMTWMQGRFGKALKVEVTIGAFPEQGDGADGAAPLPRDIGRQPVTRTDF